VTVFQRILVPLDGSETAQAVLPTLRALLRRSDSEVVVFRAIVPEVPETDYISPPERVTNEAREYVEGVAARLCDEGVRARWTIDVGMPADAILAAAETEGASLVMMSTHGRTGLPRWVFGSVAEKVLRASPVPVLAVRSFGEPREIRRILVPVDGSDRSRAVVEAAREVARLFDAKATLLHVAEDSGNFFAGDRVAEYLDGVVRAFEPVEATPIRRRGDPAAEILEACASLPADLIAMSTHGRSGLSRWMLGSVTEKVLRSAQVPMLVVRSR
jgi:nucleotide-binding universal stress UspA family protein